MKGKKKTADWKCLTEIKHKACATETLLIDVDRKILLKVH